MNLNTLIQNQIIEPFMKEVNWKNDEKCYGVEFNIEKTNKSSLFEKSIIGPASITVEKFVRKIVSN